MRKYNFMDPARKKAYSLISGLLLSKIHMMDLQQHYMGIWDDDYQLLTETIYDWMAIISIRNNKLKKKGFESRTCTQNLNSLQVLLLG